MRKFLGLIFCFIALTSSAQLKLGVNAGYQMAQFGIKGGYTNDYDLSAINGYHVGLIADEGLSKKFYLNVGLEFNHKGGIVNKPLPKQGTGYTMTLNYLQIPVILNYKLPITKSSKLMVGAGLYGAFGLSGKFFDAVKYNGTTLAPVANESVEFTNNSSNINEWAVKPFDKGYIFNVGIEWKKFQFKLNYSHGFGGTNPRGNTKFANETYGISAAYLLPW